jgi:single-stranded-DNA-specific exonuclease
MIGKRAPFFTPGSGELKDQRIEKFMKAQKAAVKHLKNLPHRLASIVHHNDTDGISSGAILKEALGREGFQTENIPIERVHPSFLPRIHTPERKLIFYADLGSQAARLISGKTLEGTSVIILDHHPPFQEDFPNLIQVNPETFGIDGDLQASAAAVAFFWARTLDEKNDDLAYLAVLGAIGDNQILEGRMTGLNQMALEAALGNGMIHPAPAGPFPFRFPLFKGNWGDQVSREITNLAANGYYRGGAELALAVCLEGPTGESEKFAAKMRELEQDRFRREIERVQSGGIPSEGDIQWVDVADRFYPLGLKAIGIFCEEIGRVKWAYGDKYIVGFQDFPGEVPLLGKFEEEDTKVSMRVPPVLRAEIEKGKKPHLAEILPPAAEEAGGFAEGCHRFAAAGIVPRKRKKELIRALNRILGK